MSTINRAPDSATGERGESLRPPRPAVALILAGAVTLGLLPFAAYIGWWILCPPYLAVATAFIGWKLRGRALNSTERPGALEWVLAASNALGLGASGSLVGFMWYGMAYLAGWLASFPLAWAGLDLAQFPRTLAFWVAAIIAGMFALAVPQLAVQEVVPRLYPDVAGQRSAYYPFIGKTRETGLLLLAALALATAGPWFLGLEPTGLWITLGVTVLFVGTASLLLPLGEESGPTDADRLIEATLADTLSAVGYDCVPRPKTDNPTVDPMIAAVDLLAVSGDTAYAMKIVRQGSPDATPDRSLALEIRVGAAALQESMNSGPGKQTSVRPYLLVVGGDIPAEYWSLVGEIGVKTVHVSDPAILRQTSANSADIALRVLQLPAVTNAAEKVAAV